LLHEIAEATWACGDPGIQFDDTINSWHTTPHSGRINASNPCSEYVHLDNSACNLSSINLLKFLRDDGSFAVEAFRHVVYIMITAQEILVGNAAYPTPAIERNSHDFRTLGLGYANLGALLMARGLPYDSDVGRAYVSTITALMTGQAYSTSAQLAQGLGAFAGYANNRDAMLQVMRKHQACLERIEPGLVPGALFQAAEHSWQEALTLGTQYGYRNAQVSLLAPTGTISFMLDCDTTGIEPDLALVKHKKLVGGGTLKLVNTTVPLALTRLGYTPSQIEAIVQHVDRHGTMEGAPELLETHLPVFDCAFPTTPGGRSIHWHGHVKMMAAVQPWLSGAMSKTVNVPHDATVEEIEHIYIEAWKLGIKCIAIYRDGCKHTQPLNTQPQPAAAEALPEAPKPVRRRLPDERPAITHKFSIAGHEGYITVGRFEDGTPGEIFLRMAKEGSTISGLMDAFATSISLTLQYGVPLKALVDKFSHMRFEPAGFTNNREIPIAKSVMDYIFRWLASKFLDPEDRAQVGIVERSAAEAPADMAVAGYGPHGNGTTGPRAATATAYAIPEPFPFHLHEDAPSCAECGALMMRSGTCYKCLNCGATSGCS
jgi:ribonucleoside-diphosphate reductase alpha chain